MSPRVKLVIFGSAGLGVVCFLLLGVVGTSAADADPEAPGFIRHALTTAGCLSLVACLVMLHGHGTSCPSCRRWWAKKDTGNELVNSDEYCRDASGRVVPVPDRRNGSDEDGAPIFKVVTYHYKHECSHCRHKWITAVTDEYKTTPKRSRTLNIASDSAGPRRQRRGR